MYYERRGVVRRDGDLRLHCVCPKRRRKLMVDHFAVVTTSRENGVASIDSLHTLSSLWLSRHLLIEQVARGRCVVCSVNPNLLLPSSCPSHRNRQLHVGTSLRGRESLLWRWDPGKFTKKRCTFSKGPFERIHGDLPSGKLAGKFPAN